MCSHPPQCCFVLPVTLPPPCKQRQLSVSLPDRHLPNYHHTAPELLQKSPQRRNAPTARSDRESSSSADGGGGSRPLSLETLTSFEAFCWRSQETLCQHAAQIDGLGTFHVPSAYSPSSSPSLLSHTPRLSMTGGRAFAVATVDVSRNTADTTASTSPQLLSENGTPPHIARRSTRRVLTTSGPVPVTAPNVRESVGITINLRPRDENLPSLRASAHYFQIGGGRVAWWFAGCADLCLSPRTDARQFGRLTHRFFDSWQQLCDGYRVARAERAVTFLKGCWGDVGGGDAARKAFGVGAGAPMAGGEATAAVRTVDRDTSFRFVTDMVDQLLPAYLPLLSEHPPRPSSRSSHPSRSSDIFQPPDVDDWPLFTLTHLQSQSDQASASALENETVTEFTVAGGSQCESVTVQKSPLGSWRFSLSPSIFTPAGREYESLRNNSASPPRSFLYL